MLDAELKQGGWSLLYYDTLKLIGKYKIKGSKKVNPKTMEEKDVFVNINYAEVCLLNIIIQLGNIKDNTSCTMKNSNLSEIMNAEERQVQLYLHNLKQIGVIYSHEDRLKGNKCITTKRTIYVDYAKIKELSTCEKSHVVETQPHVKFGTKDMLKTVPSTCEISHPNNDNNNDIYNDSYMGVKINTSDIKISRTGELEYILKRHNIDEEDIKNIIRDNNIDDVTDFICFLYYMTKKDDCIAMSSVPKMENILSAYFVCNKLKDIRSGYELYKEDIIEYASEEQKILFTTSNFFHQFSSSATLDSNKIESLKRLLSHGARLGTSFFKRNLGRTVAG